MMRPCALRRRCIDAGMSGPGCGSHGNNGTQDLPSKMDDNETAIDELDVRQNAIKNDKIRQHVQALVAGDGDCRVGIGPQGYARWDSKSTQVEKQLKLTGAMRNGTENDDRKGCFDDAQTAIIKDYAH